MNAVTLAPWIEGYLDYQRTVRRLAPRSLVDLRCTLKRVARDMEASHPGVALWKLALNDYVAWVNRQRAQEYSVQSINKDLSHVRGLLEYAWRSGHAQRNVLDGFRLQDAVRREVPKSLGLEQARQLVEACPVRTSLERRDRLVVLLLYGCGLRPLELCQLDVADVDRERQELTVRHGKGDRSRACRCRRESGRRCWRSWPTGAVGAARCCGRRRSDGDSPPRMSARLCGPRRKQRAWNRGSRPRRCGTVSPRT